MDQEYQKLVAIIVDVLGVSESEITPDTTFTDDLGADSLDVTVDPDVAATVTTVGQALELIKNAVEGA